MRQGKKCPKCGGETEQAWGHLYCSNDRCVHYYYCIKEETVKPTPPYTNPRIAKAMKEAGEILVDSCLAQDAASRGLSLKEYKSGSICKHHNEKVKT